MTQWLILAGFLAIAYIDWKYRTIPNVLLIAIAVFSLIGRTRIQIYEHIAVGAVALLVGFLIYKVGQWAAGDIWLMGAVGLAFGFRTPYVVLIAALTMITYQSVVRSKVGLPWGVPVAVGATALTLLTFL